jgi:hypothetical protein
MSHKEIAKALIAGAAADIWFDAYSHGEIKAMRTIDKTQKAMIQAAEILKSCVNAKTPAFNHGYDFAFEVFSDNADALDVIPAMLRSALLARISRLSDAELMKACGRFDTVSSAA